MTRIYFSLLIFFFSINVFAFSVIDDDGHTLQFAKPVTRIISLAPDITEILFAVNADKKIIAVMAGSDYPAEAKKIPIIGTYAGIDVERIIRLQPDLIITWDKNFARQLTILNKLNIPIYHNNPKTLNDVSRSLINFGLMTGNIADAKRAAQTYRNQLQDLKNYYGQKKIVNVFFEIGDSLLTVNKTSWINQVITFCGGKNLFADNSMNVAEVDLEAILRANPESIISSSNDDRWQSRWQKWSQLNAVKHHFLFSIPADLLERASPRLSIGAKAVCEKLQQVRTTI